MTNWNPHYQETKDKAYEASKLFRETPLTVEEIAVNLGKPLGTIYRWLRWTGDINGKKRTPDNTRWTATKPRK
jgi:DNA invertase Pin-like site-specific DNA recombinase